MAYFLVKLIPPRKTFNDDMTEDERRVMRAHVDYWLPHLNAGLVIAMGPVADPEGVWGVMIANAPSRGWLEGVQARIRRSAPASGFVMRTSSCRR